MLILRIATLLVCFALAGVGCDKAVKSTVAAVHSPAVTPEPGGPDFFDDVTAASGINFAYRNGEDKSPHLAILESLGGGVALIDYDGDGLVDIFIPGGGYYDGANLQQIKGHTCKLYKNLGSFKFRDVTAEVGLTTIADSNPWFYSHGAAVGDYDRDGFPDLLVTGWGRVALFHNVSDGHGGRKFEDVSAKAGLATGITWATSAAWADLDGDGFPELYICQYVNWSFDNHPKCDYDGKTPDVCPPKRFSGLPHKLFRNNGNGTFTDVSTEAGLDKGGPGGKGLGVLIVDVDLDGKPEIYVANDTVDKFLYLNRSTHGKLRFVEEAGLAGVAGGENGGPNGSMGVDAGDPDCVGLPYLWVTNYEKELHALYKNRSNKGNVHFTFHTPASGIAALDQTYVGWGTGFLDLDHHGWEDLVVSNGHAIRYPSATTRSQKPVLLRNQNGKFKDITARGGPYFQKAHLGRGLAIGDLNNDGKMDLVIAHINEPIAILKNVAQGSNHWIGIELVGKDFADVVGTRVMVEAGGRKQYRFAKGGGSYASAPDKRFVVGIEASEKVDRVVVRWPNGIEGEWVGLNPDQYHKFRQGSPGGEKP